MSDLSASMMLRVHARPPTMGLMHFAEKIHADNDHWWRDPATGKRIDRDMGEMLMLVVSEIAEAMEGERKNLMDDHLPNRPMAEVELADAVIRLMDIAGSRKLELDSTYNSYGAAPPNKGAGLFEIAWAICDIDVNNPITFDFDYALGKIKAYAAAHGYDLWGAVYEKHAYNQTRADHKPEARLAANGKKW